MKDGNQVNARKQSYRVHLKWPDHLVSVFPLSKKVRGLFSRDTEEGLQTQEADMVEKIGEV